MDKFWLGSDSGSADACYSGGSVWLGPDDDGKIVARYRDGQIFGSRSWSEELVDAGWNDCDAVACYSDGYVYLGSSEGNPCDVVLRYRDGQIFPRQTGMEELIDAGWNDCDAIGCYTGSDGGAIAAALLLLGEVELEDDSEDEEEESSYRGDSDTSSEYTPSYISINSPESSGTPKTTPCPEEVLVAAIVGIFIACMVTGLIPSSSHGNRTSYTPQVQAPTEQSLVEPESSPTTGPPASNETVNPPAENPAKDKDWEYELFLYRWLKQADNSDWWLATIEDYKFADHISVLEKYFDNKHPFFVVGDFNKDGFEDMAAVLIHKSSGSAVLAIYNQVLEKDARLYVQQISTEGVRDNLLFYDRERDFLMYGPWLCAYGITFSWVEMEDGEYHWLPVPIRIDSQKAPGFCSPSEK